MTDYVVTMNRDIADDQDTNYAQRTRREWAEVLEGPADLNRPTPWLVKLHKHTLMYRLHHQGRTINDDEPDGYRINLSDLQRMRLRRLQAKLVQDVVNLRFGNEEPLGWDHDLHQYIKALQDYEYMVKFSEDETDPFIVTAERCVDSILMRNAMDKPEIRPRELRPFHILGPLRKALAPITIPRSEATSRSFKARLGVATVGCLFLIIPMWIMVLHNTLWTGLVATTAFVAAFGLLMAFFLSDNIQVLSSSAAYAAVLVVFVGLTTNPQ
ncbi:hypothetical protein F4776DRAFT_674317 [Hypoxylon sp. NC0597]|nr:hypothetical protein F4776DRAFT_674317 [Hypoxylon sp. NC0597]